jgi:hypothetical protein
MLLALSCALLFVFALGLVQAWTIWYLRRHIQRLDTRIGEALDDEDLMEFQERLQALLVQARETAAELSAGAEQRREALERSLEKVREAEKILALKALSRAEPQPKAGPAPKAAKETARDAAQARAAEKRRAAEQRRATGQARAAEKLRAAEQARARERQRAEQKAREEEQARQAELDRAAEEALAASDAAARRSYLVRPPTGAPARYQKIYDLADQGLNREQIAKDAGILPGEVDLILNLRRKN